MFCTWALLWGYLLLALKLTIESPPELRALTLSASLHSSSRIPYGAYIHSQVTTLSCFTSSTALIALVPSISLCPLSTLFEALSGLNVHLVLLSEELKDDVPQDFRVPVVLLSTNEVALLTKHSNVSIRADFREFTKERPTWKITSPSGAIILAALQAFKNTEIEVETDFSAEPNLWINGEAYEGKDIPKPYALPFHTHLPPASPSTALPTATCQATLSVISCASRHRTG